MDLLEQTVSGDTVALKLEELETERSLVMLSVCKELNINPEEATISLLAQRLPAEESAELLKLRDTILSTLDELGSQGKVNERFIKDSLSTSTSHLVFTSRMTRMAQCMTLALREARLRRRDTEVCLARPEDRPS